ncbi:hypothetical protein AVEN_97577-1 [Araneus ventricosus]|uniref:Uncharacterized protein n=1 Tax=Araneus ventricosus TaxID=182803 RepID=A0A4Y2F3U3_ARAVE|nr:hypothetical protein AVEN_97577-1 [Araneus ventricosus]
MILLLLLFLLVGTECLNAENDFRPPHIIFIFADDLVSINYHITNLSILNGHFSISIHAAMSTNGQMLLGTHSTCKDLPTPDAKVMVVQYHKSILIKVNVCVCVRCPDESIALTAMKFGTQVVVMVTQCTSKPEF